MPVVTVSPKRLKVVVNENVIDGSMELQKAMFTSTPADGMSDASANKPLIQYWGCWRAIASHPSAQASGECRCVAPGS